jgi:hypothetical protein
MILLSKSAHPSNAAYAYVWMNAIHFLGTPGDTLGTSGDQMGTNGEEWGVGEGAQIKSEDNEDRMKKRKGLSLIAAESNADLKARVPKGSQGT